MDYAIYLQILMELSLAVSGEQDLDSLLAKTTKAFHRKLDCTHISIYHIQNNTCEEIYVSPHWARIDEHFTSNSKKLSDKCIYGQNNYAVMEDGQHYYYSFVLKDYGTLNIARGQLLSIKLIKELQPILNMLATNILACYAFKRQIQIEKELRNQNDYIEYIAYHDSLTALPNRRKYIETLSEYLNNDENGAVILLDLDNFKRINDTLGHVFGDDVLKYFAKNLCKIESDFIQVYRFGGDEFILIVRNKNRIEIETIVKELFIEFNKFSSIGEQHIDISFSIGITLFPEDSKDVSQLLMNADLALYSIKNNKKNAYRFFDLNLSKDLLYKLTITNYLNEAIANDGFKLVYQPLVDVKSGYIISYEALLRFKYHSTSPADFIPIAEENQSIIAIGRLVTSMAIKQLREWIDQGYTVKPISINFSPNQIYDVSYIDFIKKELKLYKIEASLLEIEITETIFIKNKELTLNFLKKIKSLGIKLSIDDFGTGYSSLNYLTYLPLDKIKLDRSINERFLELETIEVMDSLISLAHSLNFTVVAEGIELEKQYHQLSKINCDIIQGFLFSKPLEEIHVPETFTKNYLNTVTICHTIQAPFEVPNNTNSNIFIPNKDDSIVS